MRLSEQLQEDLKKAAKERDSLALSALRMTVAAIRNRRIDAITRKEIASGGELPEEAELKVLATMVKQRRESASMFRDGNRPELAEKEEAEIVVLERYLPKALSDEELESIVREALSEAGAVSLADIGKAMKVLMPKVAGRADGKRVNEVARKILS